MDTNVISQWRKIKKEQKDNILFFRLGDFYEVFEEDACICSKILGITLTKKRNKEKSIPMAGVPFRSANLYIKKLIENGYHVSVCEQIDCKDSSSKIKKREVVKVVSSGTALDDDFFNYSQNNYVVGCFVGEGEECGIFAIDILCGKASFINSNSNNFVNDIMMFYPKEIISNKPEIFKNHPELFNIVRYDDFANPAIVSSFLNKTNLGGLSEKTKTFLSISLIINYVSKNLIGINLSNIDYIEVIDEYQYLKFDKSTRQHLEINNSNSTKNDNSLVSIMDFCKTSMGSRKLKNWLNKPLGVSNFSMIIERQNFVEAFLTKNEYLNNLQNILAEIPDIETSISRCKLNISEPKDLLNISDFLSSYNELIKILELFENEKINNVSKKIFYSEYLHKLISSSIKNDKTLMLSDGGFINSGVYKDLDCLAHEIKHYKDKILDFEIEEQKFNEIKQLKICHKKQIGFYIEVPNSKVSLIKRKNYIFLKSLKDSTRYQNEFLLNFEKEYEIMKKRYFSIEKEIFKKINDEIKDNFKEIKETASLISDIDVLSCFAFLANKHKMTKPSFNSSFEVVEGRHFVIDSIIDNFISNDLYLYEENKVAVITGANMGGKSTFMRQNALIAVLAHVGSFVPAKLCNLPLFDGIYTRMGSGDNISEGISTFMQEMKEAAYIVNSATSRSLVILDELGRGTSTEDGYAIACAILGYIHKNIRAYTLFSTHYNQIKDYCKDFSDITALNTMIEFDSNGDVIFKHKIISGFAEQSYGINVAKLAGIKSEIIDKALEYKKDAG